MKRALVIIDLQNDFLPNGALPVAHGDQIIGPINQLIPYFDVVVASQDNHPQNHMSFAATCDKKVGEIIMINGTSQRLWPTHCVSGTWGAQFPHSLNCDHIDRVFYKGCLENRDSYSVFLDQVGDQATEIDSFLKAQAIVDLTFVGLATDYCVKASVLDALKLGYNVNVVYDACKAVNIDEDDEKSALAEMKKKGACLISYEEIKQASLKTVSF